jgi:Ca-activated chloride channel family protein
VGVVNPSETGIILEEIVMKRLLSLLVMVIVLVGTAVPAFAQDTFPEPRPVMDGQVFLRTHRVQVDIENQVATTRVEQVFVNESDRVAEGTYVFPLPRGATVSDLVMWVDGEPIEARILDADDARQTYEEIVRTLRDPALLEYIGQDAIQASVFPIQPHDEARIEIEYSHILGVEGGLVRYVYPLRTDQLSPLPVGDLAVSVNVTSNDAIGTIYSPTHDIAISREDDFEFRAGYETTNADETTDFNLYYSVASDDIDINLLTYRESAIEEGFFLLLIAPPSEADADQIVPRDVIVVLDQSGSMFGEKWDQARGAAEFVLDNLNEEDRFNVISFSTGSRIFAEELQSPQEADEAKDWLQGLEAIGGTEIDAALRQAFEMADDERQTVVLFLTDGVPTEGETDSSEILEEAMENAPNNVRLFSFGVGDDVDTFLLDSLANAFRGASAYVRPNERIDEEVSVLYDKVSSPVMTDISLDFGDMRVEDMYPAEPLPDLFLGTQLIIAGRYSGDGETDITLRGEVNGEERSIVYSGLDFRANAGGEVTIPRLWATRKIGSLLNSIRLNGENRELVDSIVRLSTRYGIVTPYTSFFIDETDIFTQQGREDATSRAEQDLDALDDNASGSFAVSAADSAISMEEAERAAAPPSTISPQGQSGAAGGPVGGVGGGDTGGFASNEPMESPDGFAVGDDGRFRDSNPIQVIEDRTFVLRQNTIWMDTTYDASSMTPQQIVFLSDEYFDLLDEHPEIGAFLALGDHIILVIDGEAYEILPE